MKTHRVTGGGGIELHVHEAGNPAGKPILFIHGVSQCGLAWSEQLSSALAADFRLVAMDIRGHGLSERPRDAYGDPQLWADDVHAVITALGLEQAVLSGWSYAGVIVSDYLSCYGEDGIAGTHWVGAVTRMGQPLVEGGFLGADFLGIVPELFADDANRSVDALRRFIRLCVREPLPEEDAYAFLGWNCAVSPSVRRALLTRNLDNDAVVRSLRKPVLVSYGDDDRIVAPAMAKHIEGLAAQAAVSVYPGVGHTTFREAPERFNRELAEFRSAV